MTPQNDITPAANACIRSMFVMHHQADFSIKAWGICVNTGIFEPRTFCVVCNNVLCGLQRGLAVTIMTVSTWYLLNYYKLSLSELSLSELSSLAY